MNLIQFGNHIHRSHSERAMSDPSTKATSQKRKRSSPDQATRSPSERPASDPSPSKAPSQRRLPIVTRSVSSGTDSTGSGRVPAPRTTTAPRAPVQGDLEQAARYVYFKILINFIPL